MEIEKRLQKLLNIKSNTESIISFYFNLDPGQRENRKYRTEFKNLVKNPELITGAKNISESELDSINKKLGEIEKFINDDNKIRGFRGLALFCSLNTKLWDVFNVPVIKINRIILDKIAHVAELMKINNDFGKIALLIIDQTKARLFSSTIEGIDEISGFLYPGATKAKRFQSPAGKFKQRISQSAGGGMISQGFGEYTFNRSIENELHQHFKYVSDRIFDYYKTEKFDRLIIGGDSQLIEEFRNHLHSYLHSIILGNVNIDVDNFSQDEFMNQASQLVYNTAASNQERVLGEFEEKLGMGYAVNGVESVLNSLYNGQIRTVIMNEGYFRDGYICPDSGVISINKGDHICPEQVEPAYTADVVDHLIEQAIRMNSELEVIKKEKFLDKIDGIGAILRFVL